MFNDPATQSVAVSNHGAIPAAVLADAPLDAARAGGLARVAAPIAARRYVCLRVTVPGNAPHDLRRQLHRLLGDRLGLYLLRHDARQRAIAVELELAPADLDAVISALLHGLPRATLGRVTPLARAAQRGGVRGGTSLH
ncbi:hypothetical protein ACFSUI_15755 [Ralstonia solanacearum]